MTDHPIPLAAQKLSLTEIENGIADAAAGRGWLVDKKAPGHLVASFNKQIYEAVVDVKFTQTSYSIVYNSSRNLIDPQGNIHYNYGRWVNNLDEDIRRHLAQAVRPPALPRPVEADLNQTFHTGRHHDPDGGQRCWDVEIL